MLFLFYLSTFVGRPWVQVHFNNVISSRPVYAYQTWITTFMLTIFGKRVKKVK